MTANIDNRVITLLVERHLNKLPVSDWAIRCLEEGFDSPSLRMLAGMLPTESPVLFDTKLALALEELGWSMPLPVAMLQYARLIAGDVINGKADPIDVSRELYSILSSYDFYAELWAWYDIDEQIRAQDRYTKTGGKDGYFYCELDDLIDIIKRSCSEFLRSTQNQISSLANTSFHDAEETVRRFVSDNDCGSEIRWVFFDDVISTQTSVLIRQPLPSENRDRAKACFDLGKERNLGVGIHVLCSIGDEAFCYIVLPVDEMDAQYRLMGNRYLKLSVRRQSRSAERVGGILWVVKSFFAHQMKAQGWDDEIPNRTTLLPTSN